jgi:hypothetical protein
MARNMTTRVDVSLPRLSRNPKAAETASVKRHRDHAKMRGIPVKDVGVVDAMA